MSDGYTPTLITLSANDILQVKNNLSDVANKIVALQNIGGVAATNNLSDLANLATALANLGGLAKASNLSDVANAATALANLAGAPLASPAFTGTPTTPTPVVGDNSTKIASTAFVQANGANPIAGAYTSVSGYTNGSNRTPNASHPTIVSCQLNPGSSSPNATVVVGGVTIFSIPNSTTNVVTTTFICPANTAYKISWGSGGSLNNLNESTLS